MKFSLPAKTAAPAPTESPMDLQALTGNVHFHCGIICKIWAHSCNFQLIQIISQPTLQEQLSPAAPGNHMTSFALHQPQDFLCFPLNSAPPFTLLTRGTQFLQEG